MTCAPPAKFDSDDGIPRLCAKSLEAMYAATGDAEYKFFVLSQGISACTTLGAHGIMWGGMLLCPAWRAKALTLSHMHCPASTWKLLRNSNNLSDSSVRVQYTTRTW